MITTWLEFVVSAAVVVAAGVKLTHFANAFSDRTGIGKGFIGVMLLGAATSLPEVITSVSAVSLFNAKDMAIANLLGSCGFNLLILVTLDFLFRLGRATKTNIVSGWLSLGMLAIVILGMRFGGPLPSFYLHPVSVALFVGYVVSLRWIYVAERKEMDEGGMGISLEDSGKSKPPLANLVVKIAVGMAILVVASVWIASVCDRLAIETGLGGTLVGAFFLALATSLPELTVSIESGRIGQLGMAVGNIFGSNIFNVGIFAIVDLAYGREGLFSSSAGVHTVLGLVAAAMSISLIYGFRRKAPFRILRFRPSCLIALVIYLAAAALLF